VQLKSSPAKKGRSEWLNLYRFLDVVVGVDVVLGGSASIWLAREKAGGELALPSGVAV
jgi:hypothetical protein